MEEKHPLIRFGLLADLHYARRPVQLNRYYDQSLDKIREALEEFSRRELDFIIELGDLKDQGSPPDRLETLRFLDAAEEELRKFRGPIYHVLGNHDTDCISKADFLQHTGNPGAAEGRTYYSFLAEGINCIVLDANFNADGSPCERGNADWKLAFIPPEEVQWLAEELAGPCPALVFVHQRLDFFLPGIGDYCVGNGAEIVEALEASGRVLAVFQGHLHEGDYSFRRGIHYVTLQGMIEGPFPENNSFTAAELDDSLTITLTGFGNAESRILKRREGKDVWKR
ncbi:MAG: metallophosphoesterase [Treponema sp.]|jgi:alkaline phosphatase|nr:metallophosphoesterase [Treponema sp.]